MIIQSEDIILHQGMLRFVFNSNLTVPLGNKKKYQIIELPKMEYLKDGMWIVFDVLCLDRAIYLKLEIPLFLFSKRPIITRTRSDANHIKMSDSTIRFIIDHESNTIGFYELIKFNMSSLFFLNKHIFGIKLMNWLSEMGVTYENNRTGS